MRAFLGTSRRRLARWVRSLAHLWRASLQFRVVTSTMLLGLAVVLLLGSYLFSAISDGLEQDRTESAKVEAARLTSEVQGSFDNSDRTSSEGDLNLLARQAVQSAASPGGDNERYLVLTRSLDNTSNTVVQTTSSGDVGLPVVPVALRQAVRADPRRQQVTLIAIVDPQSGDRVPAVIVGSQVEPPLAGNYDLYAVFPMHR